jgi:tetratricopeptide (TPR) repeat protein
MPSIRVRRTAIALAFLVAAGLWGGRGGAAPADVDLKVARQQFARAEQDEDAGRWQDALDKLRNVLAAKQTAGVQYHIALCEENLGQLVAALADYTTAKTKAQSENALDVQRLVGKRLADLDPRVPRLTVHLVSDVPNATLTLDGATLANERMGTAMPVDPGTHRVEATAPDRPPSGVEVTMHERDTTVLDVKLAPAGEPSPPPVREPAASQPPGRASSGFDRRAALVEAVAALALAGAGVGAYVAAGDAHEAAVVQCAQVLAFSPGACDSRKREVRAWDWTAAGLWAGAAGASTLAVLSWTKSSRPTPSGSSFRVLIGLGSLGLGGDF